MWGWTTSWKQLQSGWMWGGGGGGGGGNSILNVYPVASRAARVNHSGRAHAVISLCIGTVSQDQHVGNVTSY